ncbi:MAG TPA: hypothetical protein VE863_02095 [Pyrinomonadaceae bacterium]|nr:hypothetical protein [Pyrinomonadaceae bacterium]
MFGFDCFSLRDVPVDAQYRGPPMIFNVRRVNQKVSLASIRAVVRGFKLANVLSISNFLESIESSVFVSSKIKQSLLQKFLARDLVCRASFVIYLDYRAVCRIENQDGIAGQLEKVLVFRHLTFGFLDAPALRQILPHRLEACDSSVLMQNLNGLADQPFLAGFCHRRKFVIGLPRVLAKLLFVERPYRLALRRFNQLQKMRADQFRFGVSKPL